MSVLIRKISIGADSSNQYHISVGSNIGGSIVSEIVKMSENHFDVWQKLDGGGVILWKSIINMPVIVEYNTRG